MGLQNRSETYNGFVITPHSFRDDEENGTWSVGVFIREKGQNAQGNRYFVDKEALANSEGEAIERGIAYARSLIDRGMMNSMRATDRKK
jgi:hypothetical protein